MRNDTYELNASYMIPLNGIRRMQTQRTTRSVYKALIVTTIPKKKLVLNCCKTKLWKGEMCKCEVTKLKIPVISMDIGNLRTEDTGKIFEKAICLAYNIDYDGKYKYSMKLAEELKLRLNKLVEIFPMCSHTAKKGARYDFTSLTDETIHLSAKTTKKGVGKVAPQVIGQSQPKKFCEYIGITYTTNTDLKKHIQTNILTILPILINYTLDCPNIYYNQQEDTIRFITLHQPIKWDTYNFKWTCNYNEWKNSSTLKIIVEEKEMGLVEFQFHTKSRSNMAIRWYYENFLTIFNHNLSIIHM